MDSLRRPAGKEHIPIYPRGWIAVSICQLVLDIIIVGVAAYSLVYTYYVAVFATISCVRATVHDRSLKTRAD